MESLQNLAGLAAAVAATASSSSIVKAADSNSSSALTSPSPSPLAPPPPDDNIGPALVISGGVLLGLVVLTTVLRLLVRARNRMLGWDDYAIFAVVALSAARLGCQVIQVRWGDGRHQEYLTPQDYAVANRYGWYAMVLFFIAVCLMKISICLLLLRIKNERWLRYLIYAMMAGLVVTNGGVVVILLAECQPLDEYWTDIATCWDPRVRIFSIYVTIAYSILTDLLCSCLPLVVIWKVRIPLKSKLLVATGCGIGRATALTLTSRDFTWYYCVTEIWANFELFVGTIAANLALSRSIYIFFFEDDKSTGSGGGGPAGIVGAGGGGVAGSGGPLHRLSLYGGYQSHGLSFLNNLRFPSWLGGGGSSNRRSRAFGLGGVGGGSSQNSFAGAPQHAFRRQSSYSPSRRSNTYYSASFSRGQHNGSSGGSANSRTATMETAVAAPSWRQNAFARLQSMATHLPRRVAFWRRSSASAQDIGGEKGASSARSASASAAAGKMAGMGGAALVQVSSGDTLDAVVMPHAAGGRRGSVSSEVVIVGGRQSRKSDSHREHHRRSSLYYHHHLSKKKLHESPYGRHLSASSAAASDDSGLPAGAGVIKKRTEFWISEEELDRDDYELDDEREDDGSSEKGDAADEGEAHDYVRELADGPSKGKLAAETSSSASTVASVSGAASISDASTTTAVEVDVGGGEGPHPPHGAEDDLELGLHPPPRAHLS